MPIRCAGSRRLAKAFLGCACLVAVQAHATALAPVDEDALAALVERRCIAPGAEEPILTQSDFRWYYTREEMAQHFELVYHGGKRLPDRARWNPERGRLELVLASLTDRQVVPIKLDVVANVIAHLEQGLELGYFEHVFFADLGHAHLLLWRPFYERELRGLVPDRTASAYTLMLGHPRTRFLYHTAEQLLMTDEEHRVLPDRYLGWRFFTRNLVGANHPANLQVHEALDTPGNVATDVDDDYYYWGAGFSLSASREGCFPVRDGDETLFFDIGLSDLPMRSDLAVPLVSLIPPGAERRR